MGKSRQVEVVEIPTEQLAFIPGPHAAQGATFGRWSGAWRAAVVAVISAPPIAPRTSSAQTTLGDGWRCGSHFPALDRGSRRSARSSARRMVAASGARRRSSPSGRTVPIGDGAVFTRRVPSDAGSRWVPVELLLSPHLGPWTLLELMPLNAIHPNETYFRTGHRSLDQFVAALRTHDRSPPTAVGQEVPRSAGRGDHTTSQGLRTT